MNQISVPVKHPSRPHKINALVAVAAVVVPLAIFSGCSKDSKPGLIGQQIAETKQDPAIFYVSSKALFDKGVLSASFRVRMETYANKLGISVETLEGFMHNVLEIFVDQRVFEYPKIGSYEADVLKTALFAVVSGMIDEWNKKGNPPIATLTDASFNCFFDCTVKTTEAKTSTQYGSWGHFTLPNGRFPNFRETATEIFTQLVIQSTVKLRQGERPASDAGGAFLPGLYQVTKA